MRATFGRGRARSGGKRHAATHRSGSGSPSGGRAARILVETSCEIKTRCAITERCSRSAQHPQTQGRSGDSRDLLALAARTSERSRLSPLLRKPVLVGLNHAKTANYITLFETTCYTAARRGDYVIADRWARGSAESPGDITRRELYFFNLYRCLEAIVYAALVFSPIVKFDLVKLTHPALGQLVALAYLIVALSMLVGTDRMRAQLATGISAGLVLDIVAA